MTAGRTGRRTVKIRRRGRHSSPSQVEKVAVQAGRAAPAVAIAGALVAAPGAQQALASTTQAATTTSTAPQPRLSSQAGHQEARTATATTESISAHAVTVAATAKARHAALTRSTHYTVRGGDTLSAIAERRYHKAADWRYLYHENAKTVTDPNLIYPGETLLIPATVPAGNTLTSYAPRHAKPAVTSDQDSDDSGATATTTTAPSTTTATTTASTSGSDSSGGTAVTQSASQGGSGSAGGLSGTLGCSGLEQLWKAAGGNPADAFIAAEIAMAESGGNQYAHSPTNDYGYWQINASNGSLATYDAYGNARSAIILSHNGTDWYPWTTYTSGAYAGRC